MVADSAERVVDLVDDTFIAAARPQVARIVADPKNWRIWWPHLNLTVFMDRGQDGLRWSATGALVGSVEIWLEPFGDGVLVHCYVRASPGPGWRGSVARLRHRQATAWKRQVLALKDAVEDGRHPGEPATLVTT